MSIKSKVVIYILLLVILGGLIAGLYFYVNKGTEKPFSVTLNNEKLNEKDSLTLEQGLTYDFKVGSINDISDLIVNVEPNTQLGSSFNFGFYIEGLDRPYSFYNSKNFNRAFNVTFTEEGFSICLDVETSLTDIIQTNYEKEITVPKDVNYNDNAYFVLKIYNNKTECYSIELKVSRLPISIEMPGGLIIG